MPAARANELTHHESSAETDPSSPCSTGTPYQKLLHSLHNDQKWLTEINLGKRVGFYRFRGDLGTGNFSQVKLALHQLTKEQVAVKILDKSKLDQKTRKMLSREISTMEAIHHPNIIRLYEVVETYSKIHLVMEYARGGELFNKITTAGRFSENEAKSLYSQVISAVDYMHEHNLIHRDIKAENVFYSTPTLVKLGDFGFSTQLTTGMEQHLNTFCGSPPYAAPELFRDESYLGAPVDVWALGVLLYFMVTAQMPFKAQTVASLKKHIIDGSYMIPSYVSLNCKNLIEGILKQAPKDRLSIKQIRGSDWLKNVPFPNAPGPMEKYSLGPTLLPKPLPTDEKIDRRPSAGNLLSEVEVTARAKLLELGVTSDMLEEHESRAARSSVIGTYRIVVHRLQRQDTAESRDGSHTPGSETTISLASGEYFPFSSMGRKSKTVPNKKKSAKNSHSRTCAIL